MLNEADVKKILDKRLSDYACTVSIKTPFGEAFHGIDTADIARQIYRLPPSDSGEGKEDGEPCGICGKVIIHGENRYPLGGKYVTSVCVKCYENKVEPDQVEPEKLSKCHNAVMLPSNIGDYEVCSVCGIREIHPPAPVLELREKIAEVFYGGKIPKEVDWENYDSYSDWCKSVNSAYAKADSILALLQQSQKEK